MFTLVIILTIIVSILLALVVLAQAAKGQGLAGSLAAPGGIGTVFGVRRASDFLGKMTFYLAGILMALALLVNLFIVPSGETTGPSAVRQGPAPVQAPQQQAPAPTQSAPMVPQTAPQAAPQQTAPPAR